MIPAVDRPPATRGSRASGFDRRQLPLSGRSRVKGRTGGDQGWHGMYGVWMGCASRMRQFSYRWHSAKRVGGNGIGRGPNGQSSAQSQCRGQPCAWVGQGRQEQSWPAASHCGPHAAHWLRPSVLGRPSRTASRFLSHTRPDRSRLLQSCGAGGKGWIVRVCVMSEASRNWDSAGWGVQVADHNSLASRYRLLVLIEQKRGRLARGCAAWMNPAPLRGGSGWTLKMGVAELG